MASGSSKPLSTSTLSLRFMQNAHRAKQLKEVEIEKATVKDDAEWYVPQEVRDAWGITSDSQEQALGNSASSQSVTYEPSYLPFLFPSLMTDEGSPPPAQGATKPKGRRAFDKKGQEIAPEKPVEYPIPTTADDLPTSISSSKANSNRLPKKAVPTTKPPTRTSTAKEAIYDMSGVGSDLRPRKSSNPKASEVISLSKIFLKPSGVDDPVSDLGKNSAKLEEAQEDRGTAGGIQVAQNKVKRGKVKRQRASEAADEGDADTGGETEGKRKKKRPKSSKILTE